ncbi:MAG TPA: DUF1080 domain-containing protein [Chitinophagaceae bacterium]|nr:DUF1080 domain-containing protein [Chitinophagaceae bacterium]
MDNTLTPNEKKEGFILLFDGVTKNGWRTYQGKPGSWAVEAGTLYCQKTPEQQYSDLITNDQYENFELRIDWKVEPNANSGIMYMVTEQYEQSYLSGPEYQLLDNEGYKGKIEDYQKAGAAYAIKAPSVDATKPVGEWNHTVIIVNKGHVEHWLNGKKIVEYELWSDEWKAAKEHGKWKDAAGYGMSKTGHIAIQDYHGDGKVWFKNIKLRKL